MRGEVGVHRDVSVKPAGHGKMQVRQSACISAVVYVPYSQRRHLVPPSTLLCVPAGQGSQVLVSRLNASPIMQERHAVGVVAFPGISSNPTEHEMCGLHAVGETSSTTKRKERVCVIVIVCVCECGGREGKG